MSSSGTPARTLILARHGQSTGNAQNVFTGSADLPLTEVGQAQARAAGEQLARLDLSVAAAFASVLTRSKTSCALMLAELDAADVTIAQDAALNERDYGKLTGLNKDDAREKWGSDQISIWRRSYDVAPPDGESLRDTAARVLPFYIHRVLPAVMRMAGVLVVAHGNSLRALMMAIDNVPGKNVPDIKIATGEAIIYRLHFDTSVARKTILRLNL